MKRVLSACWIMLSLAGKAQTYLPTSGGWMDNHARIGLFNTYNYTGATIGGYLYAVNGLVFDSRRWGGSTLTSKVAFGQEDDATNLSRFFIKTDFGGGPDNGNSIATTNRFNIDVFGNVSFPNNNSFLVTGPANFIGGLSNSFSSLTTAGSAYPRIGAANTNPTQQDYNISEVYVAAGNNAVWGGLVATNSNTSGWLPAVKLRTVTAHPLVFETNSIERLRIDASGSVGIGTSSPTEKLSVNGNAIVNGQLKVKKVYVTQTAPWADYVFAEGYELRPLVSLEKFIKEEKHLPEVPTTAEIENWGIDLGGNQALLLKKIEELTLYIIEQEKKIDKLTRKIEKRYKK